MFCRYCGKEVLENAAICIHCGAWVNDQEKKKAEPKTEVVEKAAKLSKLFGTISFAFIVATLFFVFLAIAFGETDYYNSSSYYYEYSYIYWDPAAVAIAIFCSMAALALGIVSFVFGIKTKKCLGIKYLSTLVFILSVAMFLVPYFFIS